MTSGELQEYSSERESLRNQLEQLYDKVPAVNCKGLCHEACGPIRLSQLELEQIQSSTEVELPGPPATQSLDCPLLENGRCTVYEVRPMICRLWGAVKGKFTRCPHGCKPRRWLNNADGHELLRAVEALEPSQRRRSLHADFDEGKRRRLD